MLAVGLDRLTDAVDEEFAKVAVVQLRSKPSTASGKRQDLRGSMAGRTSSTRRLSATAEIQISETETPLHHLQTVYRRVIERLSVGDGEVGALRSVVDAWFYVLEEDVLADGSITEDDTDALVAATDMLMEQRLGDVARTAPSFAAVLRAYRAATLKGDQATADGLLAWLGGQPNVAASGEAPSRVKGEIDHAARCRSCRGFFEFYVIAAMPGCSV